MRFMTVVVAIALSTGTVYAQEIGDAARGRAMAETRCAECHDVRPGGVVSPRSDAATFQRVANSPGMSALAIEVWLTTAHREMPHLVLTKDEREDLIAYITSLKR